MDLRRKKRLRITELSYLTIPLGKKKLRTLSRTLLFHTILMGGKNWKLKGKLVNQLFLFVIKQLYNHFQVNVLQCSFPLTFSSVLLAAGSAIVTKDQLPKPSYISIIRSRYAGEIPPKQGILDVCFCLGLMAAGKNGVTSLSCLQKDVPFTLLMAVLYWTCTPRSDVSCKRHEFAVQSATSSERL